MASSSAKPSTNGDAHQAKPFGWDISDKITGEVTKTECVALVLALPLTAPLLGRQLDRHVQPAHAAREKRTVDERRT